MEQIMKSSFLLRHFSIFLCVLFLSAANPIIAQQKFVVVLDPGHGGRDPGAVGRISQEKNIVLSVVKILGEMIEKNMSDVKVVYTRTTDVFVPLEQRAVIANNNKADLFISVHTNAATNRSAYGAETFVLGLAKTQANLEVAMKENSVMMLEDDYKTTYQGFDPKSIDSYIMFELMMDKYQENSIYFASEIQKQFTGYAKRHDRGVRQAGFWVLHRTASPSVLVELGFISNQNEEQYMASARGQQELARSIYNAFVTYKREHDRRLGRVTNPTPNVPAAQPATVPTTTQTQTTTHQTSVSADQRPVFKLQIKASSTPINANSAEFRGLKNVDHFVEAGLYKYTVGNETDYNSIVKIRNDLKARFPDAFIIAFQGNKKITVQEAQRIINSGR